MMWVEVALFTAFALLLGTVAYWMWRQRAVAERHAKTAEDLAVLGREVESIAHDFGALVQSIVLSLDAARTAKPTELEAILDEAGLFVQTARAFSDTLKGIQSGKGEGSMEGVVRLAAVLARRTARVSLDVQGDFRYRGPEADVLRLVLNLVGNAHRAIAALPAEVVSIVLRSDALCVKNRIPPDAVIDDSIWEEGKSGSGSTGLGLAIVKKAADRLGWTVQHEVDGGFVTFVVRPKH